MALDDIEISNTEFSVNVAFARGNIGTLANVELITTNLTIGFEMPKTRLPILGGSIIRRAQ
jgi:hypothetical protein